MRVTSSGGTPTGTVVVSDGIGNSCNVVLLSGVGACQLPSTQVGARTLTASYPATGIFRASSDTEQHLVNKGNTSTTITSDPSDPSVFGETYDVNVTVAPTGGAAGVPTGTVNVGDGNGNNCSITLSGGSGTCQITGTPVGGATLTATYVGDASFNGSSDNEPHTVNKGDTITTITSDASDPSVFGEDYTVAVEVVAAGNAVGTPTGSVDVDDGNGNMCTVTLSGGTGSCIMSGSPVGPLTLTADYSGDGNFNTSSDTETHNVDQGGTKTTIVSDNPDASVFGQAYTVVVDVAPMGNASGTPTGSVEVDDGNGNICTVSLSGGTGSCQLNNTPVGTATLTAKYQGDINFDTSSDTEQHTVEPAPTTTIITADTPDPSIFGFAYTVEVSVTSATGTPMGTVTVDDGAGNQCTITLSAGMGSCQINNTPVGSNTLTATYNGSGSFTTSEDTEGHTVQPAIGTITIVKNTAPAIAGNGTFVFSSPDPDLDEISITTASNSGSSAQITKIAASYTVTEEETTGWRLQSISCQGDMDSGSVIDTASRTVTIDLDHAEDIVCTFVNVRDEDFVRERTQRVIANFINRRADQITANEPEIVERLTRRGTGGDIASSLNLTASGTAENATLSFSTSLRQIAGAADARRAAIQKSLMESMSLGQKSFKTAAIVPEETTGFDIWVQGKVSHVEEDTRQSDLGLLYVGADYQISPGLVIGVLGQFDWADEEDRTETIKVDGFGWLVGPYMTARLHQNLYFDARGAWGRSDNDVNPLGTFTDSFDTTRWLAKGQLTGDFKHGKWRFSPHAAVIYFEERQQSYTDSLNILIPGQTESLGRVTFGPKIAYAGETASGTVLQPHIAIKGIWDFDEAEIVNLTTGLTEGSSDGVRARVNGGIAARFASGWSVTGEGFYDGIGANDLEAYGGSVKVNMPLN